MIGRPATNTGGQPLVAVVTPVHNGERYLGECIESILAQTYPHWEYTIVNNGSTDRSLEIAERYAEKDPRIHVHNTERFLDVMGSQNTAFRQVSPESAYCKMVHADDWLFPECLSQMVALAEAYPSVGIVGAYRLDGATVDLDGLPYPSTVVRGRQLARAMLLGGPRVFGSPSAIMYRAEFVRRRPRFFEESDFHADVAACYEILREADFGFVHQVLTFTRTHVGEQSSYASRLKTYIAGRFRHLLTFGPFYLEGDEYHTWREEVLDRYYRFLANSLTQPNGGDIWKYHQEVLKAAGYPLKWSRMGRLLLPYWAYALAHPLATGRLLLKVTGRLAGLPDRSGTSTLGGREVPKGAGVLFREDGRR